MRKVPILIVVYDLQSVIIDGHYSVLGVFVLISSQAGRNEEIVSDFGVVGVLREETNMVSMAVPVELAPDGI